MNKSSTPAGAAMRALLLLPGVLACLPAAAQQAAAPVCVQDESVKERFLPVELLTGNPMPAGQELTLAPVDRSYPFVDELPDGTLGKGEVVLKGPVRWDNGGTVLEVYERKVPRAHERFALTADRTAIGRVYDDRIGTISNEGKHPVGLWSQGQERSYNTTYYASRGARSDVSTLKIEKLSCTYEGIAGAMQFSWRTNGGQHYGYIYAPGKGLVQVMTRSRGR